MINIKTFFAFDPQDTEEIRLEKITTFLVAGSCCLAGIVWTATYFFIFGPGFITLLPFLFVLIVGASLILSHLTKNHYYAVFTQIICIMYITAFIQWSVGGVFDSGFVLVWSFIGPITALLFFSYRKSIPWLILYLINLGITVFFDDYFSSHGQAVAEEIQRLFF